MITFYDVYYRFYRGGLMICFWYHSVVISFLSQRKSLYVTKLKTWDQRDGIFSITRQNKRCIKIRSVCNDDGKYFELTFQALNDLSYF